MYPEVIIEIILIIILLPILVMAYIRMKNERKWYDMLHTAAFRYQTDCYMNGTYPVFEYVDFIQTPFWGFSWKHLIPKEYVTLLEPYMEELKNDPRFS